MMLPYNQTSLLSPLILAPGSIIPSDIKKNLNISANNLISSASKYAAI